MKIENNYIKEVRNIKASVIIAAYNIERYIERCINSVKNQTLKEIQIVVVNDGSTDSTKEKIEKLALEDNRIELYSQSNKGLIEARKNGLKMAKGEYVLFIDGDDWIEINTLELLYNKAKENDSDIVLYNAYWAYDNKKLDMKTYKKECLANIKENPVKSLFLEEIIPSIWSKFINRNFLLQNKVEYPSNICFGEDLSSVLSMFINNPKINVLEKNLYNYYQRNDNLTQKGNRRVVELIDVINFIERKLNEKDLNIQYKKEFEHLAFKQLLVSGMQYVGIQNKDLHRMMYDKYKTIGIDIKYNKYIQESIKKLSLKDKFRINLYEYNYNLGFNYDKVVNVAGNIYHKIKN